MNNQHLSEEHYDKLKASGMLYEFYPDAGDKYTPNILRWDLPPQEAPEQQTEGSNTTFPPDYGKRFIKACEQVANEEYP